MTSTPDPAGYRPAFQLRFLLPRYWPTWLLVGVIGACAWLPLPAGRIAGQVLGWTFFRLNAKRRAIVAANIALCFPELSNAAQRTLVKEHFRANGLGIISLGLIWWAPRRRLRQLITTRGEPHLRAALETGRPVILLTGHFVTTDLAGIHLSATGPTTSMMKALKDPLLDWFLCGGRTRFGATLVARHQGLRPMIRDIKNGRMCYYIPDEDLGTEHSVFAPLFNIPTATITMLGRLARITGAVVIPCFGRILPGYQGFEVILDPPLENFPSGDALADATAMNRALEAGIRRAPEQYLWTLKLFRTRPDGDPNPYQGL